MARYRLVALVLPFVLVLLFGLPLATAHALRIQPSAPPLALLPQRPITLTPHATPLECTALDVLFVLDLSGSMVLGYEGGISKLDAMKSAVGYTSDIIEGWDNGSRVGMVTFHGTQSLGVVSALVTNTVPFTTNHDLFKDILGYLGASGTTPTAHALNLAAETFISQTDESHLPVMILVSDGVPTVENGNPSGAYTGYMFNDVDVQAVDLDNGSGGFRSISDVRTSGVEYNFEMGPVMFAGEPLADAMQATVEATTHPSLTDLTIHAIAMQGGAGGIFNADLLRYAAVTGGGTFSTPSHMNPLRTALLDAVQESSGCTPSDPNQCEPVGLDIYYVLDVSGSMQDAYAGGGSKLEAAKSAITQTNQLLESFNNGSRVALLPFYATNPSNGPSAGVTVDVMVPLTDDYTTFEGYLNLTDPLGSTPTPHGLRAATTAIVSDTNGINLPVFILLSDGVPTVSYDPNNFPDPMSQGHVYGENAVNLIDIRDGIGGFLPITEVRSLGSGVTYGTYIAPEDGLEYDYTTAKPLADAMAATQFAVNYTGLEELVIHAIGLQGADIFNAGMLEYIAVTGGGVFAAPNTLDLLKQSLENAVQTSGDCPPLPPDQSWSQGECPFCGNDERQNFVGPVNSFSGNYNHRTTDISVPTLGTPLRFERSYNSAPITGSVVYSLPLGYGWTHNYNVRLTFPQDPGGEPGLVILTGPRGSRMRFTDEGSGTYTAFPGIWSTLESGLVSSSVVYTVTAANQEQFIFNDAGQLTRHRDPQGNLREFDYTGDLLTTIEDPITELALTLAYDGNDLLESVTDHEGRVVEYAYEDGDLVEVTDVREEAWTYHYAYIDAITPTHRLIEIEDPTARILEAVTYDSAGRATEVVNGLGHSLVEINYAPDGNPLERLITYQGTEYTASYNARNLLTQVELADGQITTFNHDVNFNVSQTVDGNDNPTILSRNAFGQPLEVLDALNQLTTYTYDSHNNLQSVTDAQGNRTAYLYDANNDLVRITDSLGYTSTYTYNSAGDVTLAQDPLSRTSIYTYTTMGYVSETVNALGYTTTYQYDDGGRVLTQTDELGQVTLFDYDAAGNVLSVTQNYTLGNVQNLSDTYNLITFYRYDAAGRQEAVTDTLGMVTTYTYDPEAGLLLTTTVNFTDTPGLPEHTYNLKTGYRYDAFGRQTRVRDPLGYVSYTGYDEGGQVACVIVNYDTVADDGCESEYDPDHSDTNLITRYTYDEAGNRTHVTDPLGRVTFTQYDELGRPAQITQNYTTTQAPDLNLTTVYSYNAVGNVVLMTDTLGRVTRTDYDERQQAITTTLNYTTTADPARTDLNVTMVYSYNAVGNRILATDAEERSTAYAYDALNRLSVITDAATEITTYLYDKVGNQLVITDAEGRATATEYDALYRPVVVTRNFITDTPATTDTNVAITYTYDARGNRLTQTDALGRVTLWEYDALGRNITTTVNFTSASPAPTVTDLNLRTVVGYDALSRQVSVRDPRTYLTRYGYDGVGRMVATTNTLSHLTSFVYDGLGNRLSVTNGEGEVTAFEYDRANRLITTTATITVGEVMTSVLAYDPIGNRVAMTDGEGIATCFAYDGLDRLSVVTENCVAGQSATPQRNVRSEYGYDRVGNRVVFTNALGYTTTYTYDELHRLATETDPLANTTTYGYDNVGNRTTVTDAEAQVTTYSYDGLYRVATIDYSNSTIATSDVSFDYDALGNRLEMTDGTGTTTYLYDRANRLTATTNAANESVGYTYDKLGNRTALTHDGYSVAYAYDAVNRLASVDNNGTGTFDYTYDNAGRLTALAYPNGVDASYAYDGAGRLTDLAYLNGAEVVAHYTYEFDHANNRERIEETVRYPYEASAPFAFGGGDALSFTGTDFTETRERNLVEPTPPQELPVGDLYEVTWSDTTPWGEIPGAYVTENLAHRLRVYFTPEEVRLVRAGESTPSWMVGLAVSGIGYGDSTIPLSVTDYVADGNRMEYHRALPGEAGEVVEWYINSAAGLEQGFTFSAPPGEGAPGEPLAVEFTFTGANTIADVVQDGNTLEFRSTGGVVLFRYSGLYVYDANGQSLPAVLEPVLAEGAVVGVRLEVEDSGALYPVTIDPLLAMPAWVATSPSSPDGDFARYGHAVSSAGDVNGDGYADLLVGAPHHDVGADSEAGAVFLYMGSAEGLTTTAALTLTGIAADDHFGFALATIGDVNGDGDSDILVGAPGHDSISKADVGKVYVYVSDGSGSLSTTPVWTWEGGGGGNETGRAVAGLGDVNDDDIPDIAVGVPLDNGTGRVEVFYGTSMSPYYPVSPSWSGMGSVGGQNGAQFGATVAAAGDVNGDGINDLLVGAPYHDDVETDEGKVFGWYGSDLGLGSGTAADWTSQSDQAGAQYGLGLSGAGDVNDDGYDDVVIGMPEYDGGGLLTNTGRVVVYAGTSGGITTTVTWSVTGTTEAERVGMAVGQGDVNGDGYSDVIIGGSNVARAYHGSSGGLETVAAWAQIATGGAYQFGFAVAGIGDVNGDGPGDVAVGAPQEYTFLTAPGYVYVYHGEYDFMTLTREIDYTYDPLYRLIEADYSTGEFYSYTYDAVGNRLTQTIPTTVTGYTYDRANRLTHRNGNAIYTYDDNGNLLSDGGSDYDYDGANRLVTVTQGVDAYGYTYDGVGNRLTQHVNGVDTNYTLDVVGGLPEVIQAGTNRYLQVGGQLLAQTSAGDWQYVHPDHLGSVRQVSDAARVVVLGQDYDPFGNPIAMYGAETSAFGYTGEGADESGLLFLRARYYDAETGRFLSQDPFEGTLDTPYSQHPYQYGYSNPVRYTDPSGRCISIINAFWAMASPDLGEFSVMRGPGSLSLSETQALQAECEGNLSAAGAQWTEGDWLSTGIYATGTAGEVQSTADGFWSVNQALLTTYNSDTTWQERLLAAAEVTVYALSWAPAPGAGSIASQLDDIGRKGGQFLNSISSCVDDLTRWVGQRGNVRGSGSANYNGVIQTSFFEIVDNPYKPDIVYRALTSTDRYTILQGEGIWSVSDPTQPITRDVHPISHVANIEHTPWISTGRNYEAILERFNSGNGIAVIDLNIVRNLTPESTIVDISQGFPGKPGMLSNWARKYQEVLIWNFIPVEAISEILNQ
jgi:RHS repeat-associated protein